MKEIKELSFDESLNKLYLNTRDLIGEIERNNLFLIHKRLSEKLSTIETLVQDTEGGQDFNIGEAIEKITKLKNDVFNLDKEYMDENYKSKKVIKNFIEDKNEIIEGCKEDLKDLQGSVYNLDFFEETSEVREIIRRIGRRIDYLEMIIEKIENVV